VDSVPTNDERALPSVAPRPITRAWCEYRDAAIARDCSPTDLRRLRYAFYAGASALLAEIALSSGSLDVIEARGDELKDFLVEAAASERLLMSSAERREGES
jgi:hypothetical protein